MSEPILRLFCVDVDGGDAVHLGGPVRTKRKSFDVPCPPEVVAWLNKKVTYGSRGIEGVELIQEEQE